MLEVLNALPWFAWVAIVAIVCGSVNGIVSAQIRHRERMALDPGWHPPGRAEHSGIELICFFRFALSGPDLAVVLESRPLTVYNGKDGTDRRTPDGP